MIVLYAQRFRVQVKTAQKWLDEHGPLVEIADELAWLVEHLEQNPLMWPVAENAKTRDLRRVCLGASTRTSFTATTRGDRRSRSPRSATRAGVRSGCSPAHFAPPPVRCVV